MSIKVYSSPHKDESTSICVCVCEAKVHANIKGQCERTFEWVYETAGRSRSSHTPFLGKYQFEDD